MRAFQHGLGRRLAFRNQPSELRPFLAAQLHDKFLVGYGLPLASCPQQGWNQRSQANATNYFK
jgi:hypothetical protein